MNIFYPEAQRLLIHKLLCFTSVSTPAFFPHIPIALLHSTSGTPCKQRLSSLLKCYHWARRKEWVRPVSWVLVEGGRFPRGRESHSKNQVTFVRRLTYHGTHSFGCHCIPLSCCSSINNSCCQTTSQCTTHKIQRWKCSVFSPLSRKLYICKDNFWCSWVWKFLHKYMIFHVNSLTSTANYQCGNCQQSNFLNLLQVYSLNKLCCSSHQWFS